MKAILAIYDITQNSLRTRIIKILKQEGFKRIQKSVFINEYSCNNALEIIASKIDQCLNSFAKDSISESVIIFPINPESLMQSITLGMPAQESNKPSKVYVF
jgi:CRISPR-associated endonuclease Cas2